MKGLDLVQPDRRRLDRLGAADRPQVGHHILAVRPGHEGQRIADQMRDSGLERGLLKHRGDPIDQIAMPSFSARAVNHEMVVEK